MLNKFLQPEQLKSALHDNIKNIIVGTKYLIRGTFKSDLYVVDIDVENDITGISNISTELVGIINKLPSDIKFIDLTSIDTNKLLDQPWKIVTPNKVIYNKETAKKYIEELATHGIISQQELSMINQLLTNKPNIKNISTIDELIYNKRKIRWSSDDIKHGQKKIYSGMLILNDILKYTNNVLHYIYLANNVFYPYDVALVASNMKKITYYSSAYFNKYIWSEHYYIVMSKVKKITNKQLVDAIMHDAKVKYIGYRQAIIMLFYYNRVKKVLDSNEFNTIHNGIINKIKELPDIDSYTLSVCDNFSNVSELENALFSQLNNIFKNKIQDQSNH